MSKISRLKIKLPNDINIFTIIKVYLLKKISNKIYIYIDDRICDSSMNDNIDKIVSILNNFNICIDKIIKYSEYYNIIRIYIHRLIKFNNIQLIPDYESKKNIYLDDYKLFSNKYNTLKISLISDKSTNFNYTIIDHNIYDETFLLLVIDYSENISYIPIDNIYSVINTTIRNILSDKLYFTYPEPVLSNITHSINNYMSINNDNTNIISINNISLEYLYRLSIDNIIDIISNNVLIDNYIINTTKYIDDINNNTACFIENPINVILSNNKTINIYNHIININKQIYIENKDNSIFSNDNNIKLKYGGMIRITTNQNNKLYGKLTGKSKKKKKLSTHWIPYNNPVNKTCFILEDSKQTIGLYSNFDISTKYFINIYNKIYMFKFNVNPLEYSSLILLNNSKN